MRHAEIKLMTQSFDVDDDLLR